MVTPEQKAQYARYMLELGNMGVVVKYSRKLDINLYASTVNTACTYIRLYRGNMKEVDGSAARLKSRAAAWSKTRLSNESVLSGTKLFWQKFDIFCQNNSLV